MSVRPADGRQVRWERHIVERAAAAHVGWADAHPALHHVAVTTEPGGGRADQPIEELLAGIPTGAAQ